MNLVLLYLVVRACSICWTASAARLAVQPSSASPSHCLRQPQTWRTWDGVFAISGMDKVDSATVAEMLRFLLSINTDWSISRNVQSRGHSTTENTNTTNDNANTSNYHLSCITALSNNLSIASSIPRPPGLATPLANKMLTIPITVPLPHLHLRGRLDGPHLLAPRHHHGVRVDVAEKSRLLSPVHALVHPLDLPLAARGLEFTVAVRRQPACIGPIPRLGGTGSSKLCTLRRSR
ncbi:hypothetical protein VTI74DRAFT_6160 [Chaetomium olivicolor]